MADARELVHVRTGMEVAQVKELRQQMSDVHVLSHAGTVCVLGSADEAGGAALARVVDQYAQSTGGYRAQVSATDIFCSLLLSAWHFISTAMQEYYCY